MDFGHVSSKVSKKYIHDDRHLLSIKDIYVGSYLQTYDSFTTAATIEGFAIESICRLKAKLRNTTYNHKSSIKLWRRYLNHLGICKRW